MEGSDAMGYGQGDLEAHTRCRSLVDKALASCPKVKFMREALSKLGVRDDAVRRQQLAGSSAAGPLPQRCQP